MTDIRCETDDVVVRFPRGLAAAGYVQTFLERVRVDAILEHSEATDEQIRVLADEVDSNWWAENRSRLVDGEAGRAGSARVNQRGPGSVTPAQTFRTSVTLPASAAENVPGGANAPPGSEDQPPEPGEVEDWRALFKQIQGLPQSHAMTDADIAKEIHDYRSGRCQE